MTFLPSLLAQQDSDSVFPFLELGGHNYHPRNSQYIFITYIKNVVCQAVVMHASYREVEVGESLGV